MKKLILSTAFLFIGFLGFSQQDAQFTQNMFNKLSVNPGSAGHNGGFCGTLLTRTQWIGFDGRPQTHQFSGDARFGRHGVGLTVYQDQLGIQRSFAIKGSYAYHISGLGPGVLGIGLDVGMASESFTNNFIATDDASLDPSIPNANTSAKSFDAGFGLYYEVKDLMYVGISTLHLPQSAFEDDADGNIGTGALNFTQSRHYYIMAGYEHDLSGGSRKWVLKPSILAKSDASSTQLDITGLVEYNKLVWGGVSYRLQDAVAALLGFNVPSIPGIGPGLKIGMSYDYTTSDLGDHNSGSLEFMVRYCKGISSTPKREVYHSVRFL